MHWLRSFEQIARSKNATAPSGAGLLRYLHAQDIEVLEVTGPDQALRSACKSGADTLDAENAAHAAYARVRAVTPKTRDGLVESPYGVESVPNCGRCQTSRVYR